MALKRLDLQFVRWFPKWVGVTFAKLDPNETDMAYIYEWEFSLGFWQIRKWSNLEVPK
jgi:hypothetical protein